MKAIIALNKKGVIGNKGKLPWRSKTDLQHFKRLTEGCSCIVGRKTAEKLPKLKNRALYIASSSNSIESIMKFEPDWVIGGAEMYRQLLPLCSEIHVSLINDDSDGDTTFEIPKSLKDRCIYYNFDID